MMSASSSKNEESRENEAKILEELTQDVVVQNLRKSRTGLPQYHGPFRRFCFFSFPRKPLRKLFPKRPERDHVDARLLYAPQKHQTGQSKQNIRAPYSQAGGHFSLSGKGDSGAQREVVKKNEQDREHESGGLAALLR